MRGFCLKNQRMKGLMLAVLPNFLAVTLATFWAVAPVSGGNVQMNRVSDTVIEITGGSGPRTWHLRYGTFPMNPSMARLVPIDKSHAYFSHAGWLRLVDTDKGVVTGRWHFPGQITKIVPAGNKAQIEVEDTLSSEQVFHPSLTFDPEAPVVPYWPANWLLLYRLPQTEVLSGFRTAPFGVGGPVGKATLEAAGESIPPLEEAVRRDPCSPWFRIYLGNFLRDAGDHRAREVLEAAVRLPSTDFTELLPISAYLDQLGEHDLAGRAFDRGYQDFLARGNDPRLLTSILAFILTYRPAISADSNRDSEYRRKIVERVYMLSPNAEAAGFAWQLYADYLKSRGRVDEARVWQRRADETRPSFLAGLPLPGLVATDGAVLVVWASILATLFYVLVLHFRYDPQRRLDRAAHKGASSVWRRLTYFIAGYWSRPERFAFLTILLAGWFAVGFAGQYIQAILRMAARPISMTMGSYAGPVTAWYLENRLPATPERDLLLAFSYQQSGENDKAERLYRSLPNFAESWNNLGVILKTAGKEQEARQAFEHALQLDPGLAEAALNLGRSPQSYWTELHQKYLPGRTMLAPPRKEYTLRTYLGGSFAQLCRRALGGPFFGSVSATRKLTRMYSP